MIGIACADPAATHSAACEHQKNVLILDLTFTSSSHQTFGVAGKFRAKEDLSQLHQAITEAEARRCPEYGGGV
jgi:hypothetical protein